MRSKSCRELHHTLNFSRIKLSNEANTSVDSPEHLRWPRNTPPAEVKAVRIAWRRFENTANKLATTRRRALRATAACRRWRRAPRRRSGGLQPPSGRATLSMPRASQASLVGTQSSLGVDHLAFFLPAGEERPGPDQCRVEESAQGGAKKIPGDMFLAISPKKRDEMRRLALLLASILGSADTARAVCSSLDGPRCELINGRAALARAPPPPPQDRTFREPGRPDRFVHISSAHSPKSDETNFRTRRAIRSETRRARKRTRERKTRVFDDGKSRDVTRVCAAG